MGSCCSNQVSPEKEEVEPSKNQHSEAMMTKVQSKKRRCMSAILRHLCRRRAKSHEDSMEALSMNKTSGDAQENPVVKEIFVREEEFLAREEDPWEEYQSYFPKGIPVKDSCSKNVNKWGSCIAQLGDWEVVSIKSNERVPDVKLLEEWELKSLSSTEDLVLTSIYAAPDIKPYSICEEICQKKRATDYPGSSSSTM